MLTIPPILLAIEAGIVLVTATTCYKYPSQIGNTGTDEADSDIPCDPDARVSACCGAGNICISNLYCYDANITTPYVPGTCTDQSFTDPACPCPPTTSLNYIDDVTFCPDGSYCCGSNNTACCGPNGGNLEIFYGNPGTIPSATASLPEYYSSLRVSTKSRSTTISSSPSNIQTITTASASSSPSTPSSSSPSSPTTPTATTADTTPSSSAPTPSPTSESQNSTETGSLSKGTKIAIGTVIPVVALVAGIVAWWCLKQQRSTKMTTLLQGNIQRQSTGIPSTNLPAAGELPSGLDRAELVTKQWDCAELSSGPEAAELGDRL